LPQKTKRAVFPKIGAFSTEKADFSEYESKNGFSLAYFGYILYNKTEKTSIF